MTSAAAAASDVERARPSPELVVRLATIPLLAHLDADLLERGLRRLWMLNCPAETRIVEQGEYDARFFIIVEGDCDVFISDPSRRETLTALLDPEELRRQRESMPVRPIASLHAGGFFGEQACMSPWPRSSTVVARTRALLLEVDSDVFEDWMEGSDGFRACMEETYMSRGLMVMLRGTEAFAPLEDDAVERMIRSATLLSYDKGERIVSAGEEALGFYLIRGGTVAVSKSAGDGERIISYLRAGSFFGEMALLGGTSRTATVTAATRVQLLCIDRATFLDIIHESPHAAEQMRQIARKRVRAAQAAMGNQAVTELLSFMVGQGIVDSPDLLVVDLGKCTHCGNCEAVCEESHRVPLISLHGPVHGNQLFPAACRHCNDPTCLLNCPVDAIHRDASGEVAIDPRCIGCGRCQINCPYGTISLRPVTGEEGEKLSQSAGLKRRITHRAVKCDLCRGAGTPPQCVQNCPTAAVRLTLPMRLLRPFWERA